MLKKILAISGKPGLYKLISYGKNTLIVESLVDGKRIPAHSRDKIISLGDISIYTTSEDKPLGEVMDTIFKEFDGKAVNTADYKTPDQLAGFFGKVLPDYDADRVYNNDIKKVISWYNVMVNAGMTEFAAQEEADEDKTDEKAEA